MMVDETTETMTPPLTYEQARALLEAELRRAQALVDLRGVVQQMRAWLDGADGDVSDEQSGKEAR